MLRFKYLADQVKKRKEAEKEAEPRPEDGVTNGSAVAPSSADGATVSAGAERCPPPASAQ